MRGVAHDLDLGGVCTARRRQQCFKRLLWDCADSISMSAVRGPETILCLPSWHRHWRPPPCMPDQGAQPQRCNLELMPLWMQLRSQQKFPRICCVPLQEQSPGCYLHPLNMASH